MNKLCLYSFSSFLSLLISLNSYGYLNLRGLKLGDWKNRPDFDCSASEVLETAIVETGVDLRKVPRQSWSCDRRVIGQCPAKNVKCYVNSDSKSPALCVSNLRLKKMGGKKVVPRVDEVYILRLGFKGEEHLTGWKFDQKGCRVKEARAPLPGVPSIVGVPTIELQKCFEDFHALSMGGAFSNSDEKYCDSTKVKDSSYQKHLARETRLLSRCFQFYPHFERQYAVWIKSLEGNGSQQAPLGGQE